MAKKAASPILPRNIEDPTGVDKLERGAINQFEKRLRNIGKRYSELVERIPSQPVVNKKYLYELDSLILRVILDEGNALIDEELIGGGENGWFFETYVSTAYQRGTGQEFSNLSAQSKAYRSEHESLTQLIRREPYRRRVAMLQARVFEEMKSLTAKVKADMARVLTDGIARGLNPRDVARSLVTQAKLEQGRANRIARTEIPTALRRARWDETEDAEARFGFTTMQMHMSALSPTTRTWHAERHAKLFTLEQVREWFATGANSINCYLPGTRVQGRFLAGSKAEYRGPVIKIVTASGRNLTVTPNHPIMTSRGLVSAAEINKGDYAISHGVDVEDSVGITDLYYQDVESRIEDVFTSLSEIGHSFFARVSAIDFHGDAEFMDKDIAVVMSDRALTFTRDSRTLKSLDYVSLKHTNSAVSHGFGSSDFNFITVSASSPCNLSVFCPVFPKIGSELLVAESCCFGHCSAFKTVGFQKPVYCDSGKPNIHADLLDGFSTHMSKVDVFCGEKVRYEPHAPYSMLSCVVHDCNSGNPEFFSNIARVGSGLQFHDEIIDIVVFEYFGQVYDLQEVSGLMVANGIIASNCKCSNVTVLVDKDGNPLNDTIIGRAEKMFKKSKFATNQKCSCCH